MPAAQDQVAVFHQQRREACQQQLPAVGVPVDRLTQRDLKSARGKEVMKKMVAEADIMIENMSPGGIERLGFGWDEVKEINPRLIFAQIKGFAPDGPYLSLMW